MSTSSLIYLSPDKEKTSDTNNVPGSRLEIIGNEFSSRSDDHIEPPSSGGAVNSTIVMRRSTGFQDLPISRRFVNAALSCIGGVRTRLKNELENPNAVKRSRTPLQRSLSAVMAQQDLLPRRMLGYNRES
jgi:hypothetical protein